jgi:hypothetical protein
LITLSGCAGYTPPVPQKFEGAIVVDKDFNKAWSQVVEWFASNNVSVQAIAKDSGIITAVREKYIGGEQFVDCGTLGSLDHFIDNPSIKYNVFIKSIESNKTKITLNLSGTNTMLQKEPMQPPKTVSVSCVSSGALERSFFESLNK